MRRFVAGLALLTILGIGALPAPAVAKHHHRACTTYRVTPTTPASWREHQMTALILCVFTRVGIMGESQMALYVGMRESHLYPWAWNRSSDCRGLFQHMYRYWHGRHGRAMSYLPLKQFPHRATISPFNARANAWVTAVMVKRGGWGPWSL